MTDDKFIMCFLYHNVTGSSQTKIIVIAMIIWIYPKLEYIV